ncbi:MAG TPA: phosphoribosylformylglycinamidine synthase subunit PurL [Planctomycetota bacterium]|nr:phosphoribosylformylglycinamidine synthase subunit PurL [Planctomycetota bacterium]
MSTASLDSRTLPRAWRVEVFRREDAPDPEGEHARAALAEAGLEGLAAVRSGRGYLLSPELPRADLERTARALFLDPVLEELELTAPLESPAERPAGVHRVLVARRPGVMDPTALTIERTLARGGVAARVLTFQVWEVAGRCEPEALERAALRVLANDVIEEVRVDDERLHFTLPGGDAPRALVRVPLRGADEAELERISREGCLSLTVLEMQAIAAHYAGLDRDPTVAELETLAQTWSEHCKHKTFAGLIEFELIDEGRTETIDNLLKQTIKRATVELDRAWCVSVFHDNAGIVEFLPPGEAEPGDAGWHVCFKVETHNHPSAIDPYGGAGTGVGGVIRDILGVGLGARPIANTDAFFVGPTDLPDSELPKGCMHPRRILRGVVAGVRDYGNRMGIPTVNGGVWSDPRYIGNPLVYCGTVGVMPAWAADKSVEPGDAIVVLGGRTGRDGIHGATFSSVELHDESVSVSSSAVQIGDPIQEKRVLDALLRARDARLYRGVTDCGAGGLSSAVGEMGADCGAEVHLERVPLKYPGLSAAEIWISEAQERMVLAVPPEKLDALVELCAAEDVEATAIGTFTDTGTLALFDHGRPVGELDMHFLHEGTPRPLRRARWQAPRLGDPGAPACRDAAATLLALLAMPDIASKEWIVRQYDHEVQGAGVVRPLVGAREDGPGDAAVLQPVFGSRRGIALGCGANTAWGELDPWAMATAVIDEALRNVVAVGGDPERTAILDNFSWGNCARPEQLGALVMASKGCYSAAVAYGTPFISGKDSLNNEFKTEGGTVAIPPTLYVSALAQVEDVARCVTMDLKAAGDHVYLVGLTHAELGGSHYLRHLGLSGGRVPRPDLELAPRHLRALHAAMREGLVRACHDLCEGGLAVAAAEMAFAGDLGLELELEAVALSPLPAGADADAVRLFSESCTRFLVEVEPAHAAAFEACFADLDCARVGRVVAEPRLRVAAAGIDLALDALRAAHQGGFQG